MYLKNIQNITGFHNAKLPGGKLDALILSVYACRLNNFEDTFFEKVKENLSSFDRRCLTVFKDLNKYKKEERLYDLIEEIENIESVLVKAAVSEVNYILPLLKNREDIMFSQYFRFERRIAQQIAQQFNYEKQAFEKKYYICSSMSTLDGFKNSICFHDLSDCKIIFFGKITVDQKQLEDLNKFFKSKKIDFLYLKVLNKSLKTDDLKRFKSLKNGAVIRSEDKNILVLAEKIEEEKDVDIVCGYNIDEKEILKLNPRIVYTRFGGTKVENDTLFRSLRLDEFGGF